MWTFINSYVATTFRDANQQKRRLECMNEKCDKCGKITKCPFSLEFADYVFGTKYKLCCDCGLEIEAIINKKKEV